MNQPARIIKLPGADVSQEEIERAKKMMRRYKCEDIRCSTHLVDISGHFRKFKNIPRFVNCSQCGREAELIERNR